MHIKTAFSIVAALVFGAALGCSGQPAVEEEVVAETPEAMVSHTTNMGGPEMVTGAVLETMNSGGYTYVRVDAGDQEIWAAAGEFEIAVGDRVVVRGQRSLKPNQPLKVLEGPGAEPAPEGGPGPGRGGRGGRGN